MAARPIYGKNPLKIFSGTGGPIFTKLHRGIQPTSADDKGLIQISADCRNQKNCRPMEKKYNKAVIIFSGQSMKKELKSDTLSADKSTLY